MKSHLATIVLQSSPSVSPVLTPVRGHELSMRHPAAMLRPDQSGMGPNVSCFAAPALEPIAHVEHCIVQPSKAVDVVGVGAAFERAVATPDAPVVIDRVV